MPDTLRRKVDNALMWPAEDVTPARRAAAQRIDDALSAMAQPRADVQKER